MAMRGWKKTFFGFVNVDQSQKKTGEEKKILDTSHSSTATTIWCISHIGARTVSRHWKDLKSSSNIFACLRHSLITYIRGNHSNNTKGRD